MYSFRPVPGLLGSAWKRKCALFFIVSGMVPGGDRASMPEYRMPVENENAIRAVVAASVRAYAAAFADRHLAESEDPEGTINMKIHNIFISSLGPDIQYYSALARSLDSSLGNMLEQMAISIARLHYTVAQHVEGILYRQQTEYIANILEEYKRHARVPRLADYNGISTKHETVGEIHKRHESDYYLYDDSTGMHYLIELKIGGDLDNKKARSEKEALMEQYCILANHLGSTEKIRIYFATAYNRYGEGNPWKQGRVLQFFSKEELLISKDFWNMVCKSDNGYEIIIDEYKNNASLIVDALKRIKQVYLPE